MPNQCVPGGTMSSAVNTPQGTGTTQGSKFDAQAIMDEAERLIHANAQAQARKPQTIDELTNTLNGQNYTGVQANAQTMGQVHSTAAQLVRELQAAAQVGRAAAYDAIQRIVDAVSGTTLGRMTWFMNLKNKFYGAFVNDRSEMHKWFNVFADIPGLEPYRNTFMRAFESINPMARAMNVMFSRRIEKYLRDITPVANRLGLSNEEVALLVGDWLIARGMPERNALLIRRWSDEIAQERQKPQSDQNMAFIKERQMRIDTLNRFLDSDMANYNEYRDGKIWSGGMTNGQARARMNEILRTTGLDEAELDQWARRMSAEFHFINMERARRGTLDPAMAAKFPEFEWYAPAMHANSESGVSNTVGATNDATPYNPGSYFAIEGATSRPDSAYKSWMAMANKASLEIGGLEFGNALHALERYLTLNGVDYHSHGLRSVDYNRLMSNVHSRDPHIHAAYNAMYNQGGFVANIFVRDPSTGEIKQTKRFYYFAGSDFDFNGAHFSVGMLNKALSSDFHLAEAGPIVNGLGKATSFMGQLTTRGTPLFSPVSGMRDFHERAINMVNRTYIRDDGTAINGAEVAPKFIANAWRAGRILFQGMMGRLDPNSPAGRLWQEYNDNGLFQRFTQNFTVSESNSDATLARLQGLENNGLRTVPDDAEALERGIVAVQNRIGLNMNRPGMKRLRNSMGNRWRDFLNVMDGWNDYFQNLASFSHFLTLREMGVDGIEARSGVLQEMNMNQRGTLGPWLQALAPFVVPTVQSGTALLRTLGFGARDVRDIPKAGLKGYAAIAAAFAAYSILMGASRESMGTDENGNSVFDSMSLSELSTFLPIGIGGQDEYIKYPVGFGPAQIGATLAVGWERINQNRMTPSDLMFDVAFSLLKNTSPGSWPNYDFHENPMSWLMSLLTPMPFRPLAEVATNTNYFGNDIWRAPGDEYTSRADVGRTSTPRRFHNFAQAMRDAGLDLQPEIYEHIERGLALGPIRAFSVMANQMDDIYKGSIRPSALDSVDPFLAALGITSWYGKAPNAAQSMFYEAKRKYADRIRREGIDLKKPENLPNYMAEEYKRNVLQDHGWSLNDINDYIRIWRGETALQQQGRDFNSQYKDAWLRMDSSAELRNAFDQLYYDNQDVYLDVVDNLNYFK